MNPVPLYEMFSFLKTSDRLAADYGGAQVVSVSVSKNRTQMDIVLSLASAVPPFEIAAMESLIAGEYGMEAVDIRVTQNGGPAGGGIAGAATGEAGGGLRKAIAGQNPGEAGGGLRKAIAGQNPGEAGGEGGGKPQEQAKRKAKPHDHSKVIMGRIVKTEPKPIGEITAADEKVTVRGYVCDVRNRHLEKSNSRLLSFDITDYTSTITVSKFMQEGGAERITERIKKGMYLTVSGALKISKYDNEPALDPHNITVSEDERRTDNADTKRVELHLHTKMSQDGLADVEEVVLRAAQWGHRAVAITDHGVVHAFPDAAKAAKAAKKDGNEIKVIYGVEGYLRDDTPEPKSIYHVIILARNKAGLKNLYELVSNSHIKHIFKKRPIIYRKILEKHREGLIIGSACERGEVFSAVVEGKGDDEIRAIARFYDYLEIQPLCNNAFMIASEKYGAGSEEDLKEYNRKVAALGKSLGIPVAATSDSHFLDPEHEVFRKIVLTAKGYENASDDLPLYFRTTGEMLEEFEYLGSEAAFETVVTNTNAIADMCEAIAPLPGEDEFFPPRLEGSADELGGIILRRIPELYGESPPADVTDRVESELKDILSLNYNVIYMSAQKLVTYLKSVGSLVGSRGSVGSSLVAYLAGISEVNPLAAHYRCPNCKNSEFLGKSWNYPCGPDMPDKECPKCGTMYSKEGFNIPFETFLGFNGAKIPDIDLNISNEHKKIAWDFVYEMFGREHVFRAGTVNTIAKKTAYGMVKKYLEATGAAVTKAEENRLCAGCVGVKQTTGQHPGGLVIVPQNMEVTDFCPIQYPSDDSKNKPITMHFDYHSMEDNLIKLDVLGHDNPTMLLMLQEMTGIDADDIRLDDPDTLSIFSSPARLGLPEDDEIIGKTGAIGIPEFGTAFVRQMLCDTKPENFDALIRLSGYSHGEEVWIGNAKELLAEGKAKISETISSRDDIMLFLISKGIDAREAFKVSESVRKGYGIPEGYEDKLYAHKIPKWYVDSCKKISYLFPKAHAVAYVIMAFRIAWFKVHRPLEYYSAHFYRRSRGNAFDADTMTRGLGTAKSKTRELLAKRELAKQKKGEEFSKKDEELLATLESCYEFYMRGFGFAGIDLYESDALRFLPAKGKDGKELLRPPFVAVGGLGEKAALSLAEHRENRSFVSIEEISSACLSVNKTNLDDLARIGALRNLPATSQMSLF